MQSIKNRSFLQELKLRSSWLFIGLIGSLLVVKLVSSFEEIIAKYIELASFLPLIVYMSGAVGTQMEGLIIREFSIDKKFNFGSFFYRQALLVSVVAVVFSLIISVVVQYLYNDINVTKAISLGMFGSFIAALFSGSMLPYLFWKTHQDPAEASGPMVTLVQDAMSISIYLLISTAFLG